MNDMEREDLIQYLKDAIQQETDVIAQEKIITEYEEYSEIKKPALPVEAKIEKKLPKLLDEYDMGMGGFLLFFGVGAFFAISGIALLFEGGVFIAFLLIGLGICPIWLGISMHKDGIANRKTNVEAIRRSEEEYSSRVKQRDEQYKIEMEAYRENSSQWEASDHAMRSLFADSLEKSKAILSQLYEEDRIYPKYRNLPALTSICEYLITGRCDELTGPHGAYNMYEDEVRKDTVISQMNTIIANLEAIRSNQYMLYEQIRDIQENTSRINQELREIKGYTIVQTELTALTAYYAGMQERNTRIIAAHHLLT